jgi:hypothetical protein
MSWKKHFRTVKLDSPPELVQTNNGKDRGAVGNPSGANYSSYLPEIYAGHPNRLQRYMQYDDMDRDSEINAALDIIADFCTQSEEQSEHPFTVRYDKGANETEVNIVSTALAKWIKVNNFRGRLWNMFRNTIKNGDQFFVRDPETKEWLWIDHYNVELIKVDETQGRKPVEYIIKDLDFVNQQKLGTIPTDPGDYHGVGSTTSPLTRGPLHTNSGGGDFQLAGQGVNMRGQQGATHRSNTVDAKHVIHLSLSVGMDINWPFGSSVLEPIFKTFKQKELLEDSVIIYRVQRAPERRIFKIDVGGMNPMMAQAHVERVKNEIHQRRIPNRGGGGQNIMDAAYNPISIMDDYFFAQGLDGRGSSVETLPGGENIGELADLEFFSKKLRDGLRIPPAYRTTGDEGGQAFNDGKMGAAMIQEYLFNKYCMRLQSLLIPTFNKEFKAYLKDSGIVIDDDLFDLTFNPPQNFTKYRQVELDTAQMAVYVQIQDNPKLAERFKLTRFLNLTQEELMENQRLWMEENPDKVKEATGNDGNDEDQEGLSSVGVRAPNDNDPFSHDNDTMEAPPDDGGDAAPEAAPVEQPAAAPAAPEA